GGPGFAGGERGSVLLGAGRRAVRGRPRGHPGRPGVLPAAGRAGRPRLTLVVWSVTLSGRRTIMDFRPLNDTERRSLITALRGNADRGTSILMDRRDTSFLGVADEVTDEEVINAIKSVPCHY